MTDDGSPEPVERPAPWCPQGLPRHGSHEGPWNYIRSRIWCGPLGRPGGLEWGGPPRCHEPLPRTDPGIGAAPSARGCATKRKGFKTPRPCEVWNANFACAFGSLRGRLGDFRAAFGMDLHEAIKGRKSCRAFLGRPVPDEALQRVLNAARLAVSVENQQPWRFIVVRDEEKKRKLSQAVTKGNFLNSAPLVIVALGMEEASPALVGGYMLSYPLDVAASIQNFLLAATADGLGTCWCTDFKEDRIKELFGIPEGTRVVGVLPLGYPDPSNNGAHNGDGGRRSFSEIVAYDNFAW